MATVLRWMVHNMSFFSFLYSTGFDSSLLSNIQKLFSEKIEIFSPVEFSKVSVLTGIVKIALKVGMILLQFVSVNVMFSCKAA